MDQLALAGNAHKNLREFSLNAIVQKGNTFSTCLHAIPLLAICVATVQINAPHVKILQESVQHVTLGIIFSKAHAYPCAVHNILSLLSLA